MQPTTSAARTPRRHHAGHDVPGLAERLHAVRQSQLRLEGQPGRQVEHDLLSGRSADLSRRQRLWNDLPKY